VEGFETMEVPMGVHWRVLRGADQGVAMRSEPLAIQLHSCLRQRLDLVEVKKPMNKLKLETVLLDRVMHGGG
jgi:hypothetical protein